jgi:hypothetical protein
MQQLCFHLLKSAAALDRQEVKKSSITEEPFKEICDPIKIFL